MSREIGGQNHAAGANLVFTRNGVNDNPGRDKLYPYVNPYPLISSWQVKTFTVLTIRGSRI